jgi:hypothetical protein
MAPASAIVFVLTGTWMSLLFVYPDALLKLL